MSDKGPRRYISMAERLRQLADSTQFQDIRRGYLELAYRFERLAENACRPRSDAKLAGAAGEDD